MPEVSLQDLLKAKRHLQHALNYMTREADSFRILSSKLYELHSQQREQFGKEVRWHRCKNCFKYNTEGSHRPEDRKQKALLTGQHKKMAISLVRTIPDNLLINLESRNYSYTEPAELYELIWLTGDTYCGVFGDGGNGAYEWFVWSKGFLETSNSGYGSISYAFRLVLNKMGDLC